MAVEFKPSMTKAELLEIAATNGVAADDGMTKAQIVAALEANNEAEAAAIAAQSAEGGGAVSGEGNDTGEAEKPAEAAQEPQDGPENTGAGNDTGEAEKPAEATKQAEEESGLFVYIGPSIPRGRLKENAVFNGTFGDVVAYLADVVADYPLVEKLIVPADKLAAYSVKAKTPGNIIHKYYSDIVSTMRGHKEV